jgi:ATP-dependent Clp protease ATP-binding subunit ClpA
MLFNYFKPEFLNRVDEIVVFHALSKQNIKAILKLQIEQLNGRLADNDIVVELTEDAEDFICNVGYDAHFGARPLKRAIQRYIENELSKAIISGTIKPGDKVVISVDNTREKLKIERKQ